MLSVLLRSSRPHNCSRLQTSGDLLLQEARAEMQREWRNGQKRCDKLRASLDSRIPKSWPSEMTAIFLDRVTDAVITAFNETGPPAKVV